MIRLTAEILHHTITFTVAHDDEVEAEQHDVALDTTLERADHRDKNPAAELDSRMGFRP